MVFRHSSPVNPRYVCVKIHTIYILKSKSMDFKIQPSNFLLKGDGWIVCEELKDKIKDALLKISIS